MTRRALLGVPQLHQVLTTEELSRWMQKAPRTVERMRLPTIAPGRYLFAHVLEELERRRKAHAEAARPREEGQLV